MDISNIFVIVEKDKFKKQDIVNIITSEGYKHNFFFGATLDKRNDVDTQMEIADEVWCFGNVEGYFEYEMAKELGKDIWIMA